MSQRIKTEPPRLAKTVSPNFGAHIWLVAKGIIRRDRVGEAGSGMIDIDAQHLAEQYLQILPMTLWVLLWPGVTHANVEKSIRPKRDASTAVVLRHTFHLDQPARRLARICPKIR